MVALDIYGEDMIPEGACLLFVVAHITAGVAGVGKEDYAVLLLEWLIAPVLRRDTDYIGATAVFGRKAFVPPAKPQPVFGRADRGRCGNDAIS